MRAIRALLTAALLCLPSLGFASGSSVVIPDLQSLIDAAPEPIVFSKAVVIGTLTVTYELAGGATVYAEGPILGDGSDGDPLRIDYSSITALGPTIDHAELSNVGPNNHHAPIVDTDTNAQTICSGNEYLRGDGACSVPLTGAGAIISTIRDDFTTLADGIKTDFVLSNSSANQSSILIVMDGLSQRMDIDYTVAGATVSFTTAPASDTNSLWAYYSQTTITTVTMQGNSFNIPGALLKLSTDTTHSAPLLPTVDIKNTHGRMVMMTRNRTIKNPTWKILYSMIFPGSDDIGFPREFYAAIYRSVDVGTCDLRLYDATNATVITTTSTVFPTFPTNFIKIDLPSSMAAAPALWEIQGQATDGVTECELGGITLEF